MVFSRRYLKCTQEGKLTSSVAGAEPQILAVKPNIDIGARVPAIDSSRLKPVDVPADHMPMLSPLKEEINGNGRTPYIDAEFAELSASDTARLVAKSAPAHLTFFVEQAQSWRFCRCGLACSKAQISSFS